MECASRIQRAARLFVVRQFSASRPRTASRTSRMTCWLALRPRATRDVARPEDQTEMLGQPVGSGKPEILAAHEPREHRLWNARLAGHFIDGYAAPSNRMS